jgi:hypothetical protein
MIFNIDADKVEVLNAFIEECNASCLGNVRYIIKPVYGSKGKGIVIMPNTSASDSFITNMMLIKKQFDYSIFIISIYIDNPKLYTDISKGKHDVKFNMRFYALLHINKLACFENNTNDIHYYIFKDVQIYFSVLPYNINICEIPSLLLSILLSCTNLDKDNYISMYDKIKTLPLSSISNLINLTNLEMVKTLAAFLNIDIPLQNFVMTLNEMNYDEHLKNNIVKQAKHIIHDTIDSVKHNIRHINRFVEGSSAFNLIAYDTMLDDNNQLHLIEVNRGPDLHGLKLTLGENKITSMFSEIFDIVMDGKKEDELQHWTKFKVEY